MVPLHLGYESGKLFTKANKDNCISLFFTLVRQMMFLSWSVLFPPISCKSSWHSQRRFSAQVVRSRDASPLSWFSQDLSGVSEVIGQAQGWGGCTSTKPP